MLHNGTSNHFHDLSSISLYEIEASRCCTLFIRRRTSDWTVWATCLPSLVIFESLGCNCGNISECQARRISQAEASGDVGEQSAVAPSPPCINTPRSLNRTEISYPHSQGRFYAYGNIWPFELSPLWNPLIWTFHKAEPFLSNICPILQSIKSFLLARE